MTYLYLYLYLYLYVRLLIAPQELLLAAKWAKLNRLPFPPIDPSVVDREGLKELYVFQDPDDPNCPVVLHFPLVNIAFRNFSAPGQSVSQSVVSQSVSQSVVSQSVSQSVVSQSVRWWL